jgi:hypothetical protein
MHRPVCLEPYVVRHSLPQVPEEGLSVDIAVNRCLNEVRWFDASRLNASARQSLARFTAKYETGRT